MAAVRVRSRKTSRSSVHTRASVVADTVAVLRAGAGRDAMRLDETRVGPFLRRSQSFLEERGRVGTGVVSTERDAPGGLEHQRDLAEDVASLLLVHRHRRPLLVDRHHERPVRDEEQLSSDLALLYEPSARSHSELRHRARDRVFRVVVQLVKHDRVPERVLDEVHVLGRARALPRLGALVLLLLRAVAAHLLRHPFPAHRVPEEPRRPSSRGGVVRARVAGRSGREAIFLVDDVPRRARFRRDAPHDASPAALLLASAGPERALLLASAPTRSRSDENWRRMWWSFREKNSLLLVKSHRSRRSANEDPR
eukprot:31263-Pelagococcus_subviridis.AAC.12